MSYILTLCSCTTWQRSEPTPTMERVLTDRHIPVQVLKEMLLQVRELQGRLS